MKSYFVSFFFVGFFVHSAHGAGPNLDHAEFKKIIPILQIGKNGSRFTFHMGSPEGEHSRGEDEPLHEVTLTKAYEIQTTPVTQEQWFSVMGNNPSYFKEEKHCPGLAKDGLPNYASVNTVSMCRLHPVEQVSAHDVQGFLDKLNASPGGPELNTGNLTAPYRLPTEAEWEYAARGGQYTTYSFGNCPCDLGEYAWYSGNSGKQTREVATRKPNLAGLYDVHGNVWQWVADGYSKDYGNCSAIDPLNPWRGGYRVIRGGDWNSHAGFCRSANRDGLLPHFRNYGGGFRLARTVE